MGDRGERFCYAEKGSPRGELAPVRATERGLQFLRLIVITPLRLDKLGTRPRAPSLALRAIHLVSPRRGFFTACGFVKKRPEAPILADLRSFRLRKIILLQIKIRRSTAVR